LDAWQLPKVVIVLGGLVATPFLVKSQIKDAAERREREKVRP
jgi:hypothetical protein